MSCPALTNKGGKLYISDQPVDCDLTLSELAVLPYVRVPGVGSIGDTGIEQDVVTYPTTDAGLTAQGKGDAVARNWDIEVLDAPSQARDILDDASAIGNDDNYATRIEWPNGDVEFSIVQVASRTAVKGAASGVRVIRYTMVPSFVPIVTNALPVASNVVVSGTYFTGDTLTATYDYYSPLGLPESGSTYQWYADGVAIPGADGLTYVIDEEYEGQMISFGVEPSDGLSFGEEAISAAGGPVIIFMPEMLYENGLYGGALAPFQRQYNGIQMMFQDAAGTIPVTSDGDPVGRIIDRSGNGNHIIQTVSGSRPTYKTDGTYEWLLHDGIDDYMVTATSVDMKESVSSSLFSAVRAPGASSGATIVLELSANSASNNGSTSFNFTPAGGLVYRHRGSTDRAITSSSQPNTDAVFSGRGSISIPDLRSYRNNVEIGSNPSTQGSGTLLNYPVYSGARNGSSLFFSGRMYGQMLISRYLNNNQMAKVSEFFQNLIPGINLFILAGQSNADGREDVANGPPFIQDSIVDGVSAWNGTGIVPYALNNNGPSGNGRAFVTGGFNNDYSFAHIALKTVAETLENVVVCGVTQGGTGLYPADNPNGCWNANYAIIPDGTPRLLEELENRFYALKSYCVENSIPLNVRGIIWHQGEKDAELPDIAGYQGRFQEVINRIREFAGDADLPIYFGTIPTVSTFYNSTIKSAQMSVAAADGNAYCRDNSDLTVFDTVHLDAASNATFGEWVSDRVLESL